MFAPWRAFTLTWERIGSPYIDPDECIDCGACEPECPVEAIFAEEDVPGEWKDYTAIDVLWFKDKDAARAKVNELRPE